MLFILVTRGKKFRNYYIHWKHFSGWLNIEFTFEIFEMEWPVILCDFDAMLIICKHANVVSCDVVKKTQLFIGN